MADFTNISLPRGVYSVKLRYETDTFMQNCVEVSRGTAGYKGLLANSENCYPEVSSTDFQMWVLEDVGESASMHCMADREILRYRDLR